MTHGPRSETVLGKVTEAAGMIKCKLNANLVGVIESLFQVISKSARGLNTWSTFCTHIAAAMT